MNSERFAGQMQTALRSDCVVSDGLTRWLLLVTEHNFVF